MEPTITVSFGACFTITFFNGSIQQHATIVCADHSVYRDELARLGRMSWIKVIAHGPSVVKG